MAMTATHLNFALRVRANCKTVHLLGSWDNYAGQLPLSKDASKPGGWKGSFKFQGQTLKQGQRYWYYYIIDGYHVTHDPNRENVTERTTGRKLNVIDVPINGGRSTPAVDLSTVRQMRRGSTTTIPKGRPLSQSQIQSPRPNNPQATRKVRHEEYKPTTEEFSARLAAAQRLEDDDDEDDGNSDSSSEAEQDSESDVSSDNSSDAPSLSSRTSNSSSPSSTSSVSTCCTCERYGITRTGARVKIDCGGSRCGYAESSECSSESETEQAPVEGPTRRNGVIFPK